MKIWLQPADSSEENQHKFYDHNNDNSFSQKYRQKKKEKEKSSPTLEQLSTWADAVKHYIYDVTEATDNCGCFFNKYKKKKKK